MAGNFAGHLEQAGRPRTSSTSPPKVTAPKGIFPWYAPGYDGFLGEFPLSHDAILLPESDSPLNLQIEPEVGLACQVMWQGDTVVSLQPFALGAFNDCSIRRPDAPKISHKKNWGPASKGVAAQFFDIGDLTPDGPDATLRLVCHLRTADGQEHEYGVDSPLLGYSYYGEVLLDWITERLANQKGSPDTPLEDVGALMVASGHPENVLIGIGATQLHRARRVDVPAAGRPGHRPGVRHRVRRVFRTAADGFGARRRPMTDVTVSAAVALPGEVDGRQPGRRGAHRPARRARRPALGGPGPREGYHRVGAPAARAARAARRATSTEPDPDAGPGNVPGVVITFPDGTRIDPATTRESHARSRELGRAGGAAGGAAAASTTPASTGCRCPDSMAQLLEPPRCATTSGSTRPRHCRTPRCSSTKDIITLARFSTPPGTFVDLSPVHLLSTTSLASLAADGEPYDVRRFRPNVLVDVGERGRGVSRSRPGWAVKSSIGSAALRRHRSRPSDAWCRRAAAGHRTRPRAHPQLAERTDRFLGVYADVSTPGVVRVGDAVRVR